MIKTCRGFMKAMGCKACVYSRYTKINSDVVRHPCRYYELTGFPVKFDVNHKCISFKDRQDNTYSQ